jgi:hypothetical protein
MRGVCARVIWRPCGRLSAWQPSAWIWAWSWDPLRLRDVIRRTTPALPRQNTRQGRTPRPAFGGPMSPTVTLCSFTKASHFWAKSHWKGLNLAVRTVRSNPNPSALINRLAVPPAGKTSKIPWNLPGFSSQRIWRAFSVALDWVWRRDFSPKPPYHFPWSGPRFR